MQLLSLTYFQVVNTCTTSKFKRLKNSCCWLVTKSCPPLLQPHGLQPTRLLCPWNFPGKNTGMGCQLLLQGIFPTQGLKQHLLHLLHWQADSLSTEPSVRFSCLVVSDSLRPYGLQPTKLLCPWNFPCKNTGLICHFLLQGIFPLDPQLITKLSS